MKIFLIENIEEAEVSFNRDLAKSHISEFSLGAV